MVGQVLMTTGSSGLPLFRIKDNPRNRPPISFEDDRRKEFIPRLGVRDLLEIGAFAESAGWTIDAFEIADASMVALEDDRAEWISDALVIAIRAGGVTQALLLLRDQFPGYLVTGLDLATPELDVVALRRNGVVTDAGITSIIDLLSSAWPTVRFT